MWPQNIGLRQDSSVSKLGNMAVSDMPSGAMPAPVPNHKGGRTPVNGTAEHQEVTGHASSEEEQKSLSFRPRGPRKKKSPEAKNNAIKRYVQPKNAMVCLNDLRPGVTYHLDHGGFQSMAVCMAVEVDGRVFRGYGPTRQHAKQAAAEAALANFVFPPHDSSSSSDASTEQTPWATLASFALFKLFKSWQEGPIAGYNTLSPFYGMAAVRAAHPGKAAPNLPPAALAAISAHLNPQLVQQEKVPADVGDQVPKPVKQMPENAASMHPVMLLHQLHPRLQYSCSQKMVDARSHFTVTAEIDGRVFRGEGFSVKKAKFQLAEAAILALHNIQSTYDKTSD